MSYRSFKRVLGETNIERKCRFLFGACLLLLITGSFWYYGSITEELVNAQSSFVGRNLVVVALAHHHWKAWSRPGFELDTVEDLESVFKPQKYEADFLSARYPFDGENEKLSAALAEFTSDTGEAFLDFRSTRRNPETGENERIYEYFEPIYAGSKCVLCHDSLEKVKLDELDLQPPGNRELQEGDLLGVAQIIVPGDDTPQALNENRALLLATAIITVFLAMIVAYVIVRYVIVKPVKHLRDVSDEVSRGNIDLRAEIRTGDEFEELAIAFNRMLGHLVDAQRELRNVNSDLDAKVDELAQVNMELYEMNRLRSDFLATMSHELRTPLNSILGFSEVLGSINALDDKQKRYVQNIQKSGKMLLDMINDILDLAKIESGKMELRLSKFQIAHLIVAQCDWARPLAEKKNIDLLTEVAPNLPDMYQDQGKVQQILNNLLSNAIKFTPEGGRIDVSAHRDNKDSLLLTVTDTGVGIAEEDRATIFEKFRQGKSVLSGGDAMTRQYSGTGLGLSIVREMSRLLGGEILVTSELGKGSSFTVRLPWVCTDPELGSNFDDSDDLASETFDVIATR